jgi:triosephosphate isomerase
MAVPYQRAESLLKRFVSLKFPESIEAVVCPDFLSLDKAKNIFFGKKILLGCQDVSSFSRGAYTGEVSVLDLKSLKVKYAIVGHSERRKYQMESDEVINGKVKVILENGLVPVLCVGEKDRNDKRAKEKILEQLANGLKGIKLGKKGQIVIAYEPVWAIGTGRVVSENEIVRAVELISTYLKKKYSTNQYRILYGGSVSGKNAKMLGRITNGLLVGGASLEPKSFLDICLKVKK